MPYTPTATDVPTYGTRQGHAPTCYCPACLGLQCLERPRYFSGQLLTEAELNGEQAYLIAKNKLHNRYLHGWGVVCGLQVVCHDCEGWVTVKEGYALDPCGNDIIVCDDQPFDVLKKMRECVEGRRRRRRNDCDPLKPYDDPSCDELEEHWCVTIQYEETEARPITALRPTKSCGCGCGGDCGCGCKGGGTGKGNGGGHAKKCGCGCGGAKSSASAQTQGGVGLNVAACEPTRTFERFRLDVVEQSEQCKSDYTWFDERTMAQTHYKYLDFIDDKDTRDTLIKFLKVSPRDSAFVRIVDCFLRLVDFIAKRIPANELPLLGDLFRLCARNAAGGRNINAGVFRNNDRLYQFCCRLQKIIRDLYEQNPLNVHCDPRCAPCTPTASGRDPSGTRPSGVNPSGVNPSGVNPSGRDPSGVVVAVDPEADKDSYDSLCCLLDQLVQYFIDCFCQVLLAPCPPSPEDDRVVLACLTIRKGKIVDICNFSCRHYAGSFPAVNHWLSLIPIIPYITRGIQKFCCDFDLLDFFAGLNPGRSKLFFDREAAMKDTTKPMAEGAMAEGAGVEGVTVERTGGTADVIGSLKGLGRTAGSLFSKLPYLGMHKRAERESEMESLRRQVADMRSELDNMQKK